MVLAGLGEGLGRDYSQQDTHRQGFSALRSIRQKRASELFQDRTSQTLEASGQVESPGDSSGLPSHPLECSLPGLEPPGRVRQ